MLGCLTRNINFTAHICTSEQNLQFLFCIIKSQNIFVKVRWILYYSSNLVFENRWVSASIIILWYLHEVSSWNKSVFFPKQFNRKAQMAWFILGICGQNATAGTGVVKTEPEQWYYWCHLYALLFQDSKAQRVTPPALTSNKPLLQSMCFTLQSKHFNYSN